MYWELFYRFVNIFDFVISFFVKCSLGMLKWGGVKWVVLNIFFLVIGFLFFYVEIMGLFWSMVIVSFE